MKLVFLFKKNLSNKIKTKKFLILLFLSLNSAVAHLEKNTQSTPSRIHLPKPSEKIPESILKLKEKDSQRSNKEILKRLKNLEQICIDTASPRSQQLLQVQRIDTRIHNLREVLEERAHREHIETSEAPESFLKLRDFTRLDSTHWSQKTIWPQRFQAASTQKKCEWLELHLALLIARLSTLAPSKPIVVFEDFMAKDTNDPLYIQDLARLHWEARYFTSLEAEWIEPLPKQCQKFYQSALNRFQYLQPDSNYAIQRWPMGRAFGMCGRPMHSHALDEEFEIMGGTLPMPKGWDIEETEINWDIIFEIENENLKSST